MEERGNALHGLTTPAWLANAAQAHGGGRPSRCLVHDLARRVALLGPARCVRRGHRGSGRQRPRRRVPADRDRSAGKAKGPAKFYKEPLLGRWQSVELTARNERPTRCNPDDLISVALQEPLIRTTFPSAVPTLTGSLHMPQARLRGPLDLVERRKHLRAEPGCVRRPRRLADSRRPLVRRGSEGLPDGGSSRCRIGS